MKAWLLLGWLPVHAPPAGYPLPLPSEVYARLPSLAPCARIRQMVSHDLNSMDHDRSIVLECKELD